MVVVFPILWWLRGRSRRLEHQISGRALIFGEVRYLVDDGGGDGDWDCPPGIELSLVADR